MALVTDGLSASAREALQKAGWMLMEVGLIGHEGQGWLRNGCGSSMMIPG